MPELIDIRQYVRTLPTNTLMGFGAFAALTTFWYATRPKALKPPCDLSMQSVEVTVSPTPPSHHPPSHPPAGRPFMFNLIGWLVRAVYKEKLLVVG